jgi:putative serine protease PepD
MTDDQTPPERGGQPTPTATSVGEHPADAPGTEPSAEPVAPAAAGQAADAPSIPVPPPPGPFTLGSDAITMENQAVPPGDPTLTHPTPAGPLPGTDPSSPPSSSSSAGAAGWGAPPTPPGSPAGPAPVGSPVPSSPPRRARRAVALLAAAGLMAGSAAGGAALALSLDDDDSGPATTSLSAEPASGSQGSRPDEPLSQAAAAVLPSVVSIGFESNVGTGQGSGVIISSDGQILTNNHVVAQAADGGELTVTFNDGSRADARILGRDPATDLAVIQAEDVDGLTAATLGSSDDLNVGDTVLAIGSPLGLDGSVTSGIVSALDRSISLSNQPTPQSPFGDDDDAEGQSVPSAVIDAIQTDAAVNPGNSGGALINTDGQVVGINTAIASLAGGGDLGSGGGSIGLGFAIPIDSARSIAQELVETGEVTHAFLGVSIGDAEDGGAVVGRVEPNQPADDAGLQQGDVITRVDDQEISGGSDLTSVIRSHEPGDRVTITYTRDGDEQTAEATLGELPSSAD